VHEPITRIKKSKVRIGRKFLVMLDKTLVH
jgi:hypothetical protein